METVIGATHGERHPERLNHGNGYRDWVMLSAPEMVVKTWTAARRDAHAIPERVVAEALQRLDPVWDELFPAEQARIVQLLVERVEVDLDGVTIKLRADGLGIFATAFRFAPCICAVSPWSW